MQSNKEGRGGTTYGQGGEEEGRGGGAVRGTQTSRCKCMQRVPLPRTILHLSHGPNGCSGCWACGAALGLFEKADEAVFQ